MTPKGPIPPPGGDDAPQAAAGPARCLEAELDLARKVARARAGENTALRDALLTANEAALLRDGVLRAMRRSRSWRVTAPLRALTFLLTRRPVQEPPPPFDPAVPRLALAPSAPAVAPMAAGAPGSATAAAQRAALGLDVAPPATEIAVVARHAASERLRASLDAAAREVPGRVRLFASLDEAFAAGAELALAVPDGAALDTPCLLRLAQAHHAAGGRAVLEAATFPDENPRPFDRETFAIPWLAASGWALPRAVHLAVGAPDPALGEAAAAADLGWRAQARGFGLRYVPHALLVAPAPPPVPLAEAASLAGRWGAARVASLREARWR